jgi:DNA-binding NarL/FixJ family response regulator
VRIFIAGPDSAFRMSLQLLLESEAGISVTGTSDQLDGLPVMIKALCPDVLLLDYELVHQGTIELMDCLHHLEFAPKIIVLSMDPNVRQLSLAAGADYVILKNAPPDDLLPILNKMKLQSTHS